MNANRREFLKKGALTAGAAVTGVATITGVGAVTRQNTSESASKVPLTPVLTPDGKLVHVHLDDQAGKVPHCPPLLENTLVRVGVPGRKWIMVIDLANCDGCGHCTEACSKMHFVPPDRQWIKVFKMQDGPDTVPYWFPKPCFQCDNPPCTKVCPVDATFKRQDGVVLIDNARCIGCRFCMAAFRRVYGQQRYLTFRQFRNLGTLLLALDLMYIYFTLSEYLTVFYGSESVDKRLLHLLMGGSGFGILFWSMTVVGFFIPAVLLSIPTKRSITPIVVASLLVNVGMWVKRYLIIIPTMMTPYIPAEAGGVVPTYFPTWVEWTVTAGGLAFFLLLFTLFSKLFPIVSIWETVEGAEEVGAETIGVEVKVKGGELTCVG